MEQSELLKKKNAPYEGNFEFGAVRGEAEGRWENLGKVRTEFTENYSIFWKQCTLLSQEWNLYMQKTVKCAHY